MKSKKLDSGYKIENIILVESNFKRTENINFDKKDSNQEIDVNVDVIVKDNKVIVTETVNYKHTFNKEDQITSVIKMAGIFEKSGESKIDLEDFGYINGAAIIFPFIREHLSNLAIKAGVGIILLPPLNFTKK